MIANHLTPTVTALVLFAGVVHATWNAIASAIKDKLVAFGLIGATETVVAALCLPLAGIPRSAALAFAAGSAVIHVGYTYGLLHSYRLGDFGRAYPLARGTAPVLVAVGAWFLAAEHLAPVQLAGVCVVAAALAAIVFAGGRLTRADVPATLAALATGITIASYTIVDGLGVRHAHDPLGYMSVLFLLQGPIIAIIAAASLRGRRRTERGPRDIPAGLTAGALSLVAYGIVIWAQTQGALALVSALRETSVISGALIAALIFHEPLGRRRLAPAVAVAAGIILISL
ncbi:MAG TPA: EamA family transporter [Solirubrobacteraceae bacterium]|nr:EamA family transporter [Solirubrobacteraceae bacterium]